MKTYIGKKKAEVLHLQSGEFIVDDEERRQDLVRAFKLLAELKRCPFSGSRSVARVLRSHIKNQTKEIEYFRDAAGKSFVSVGTMGNSFFRTRSATFIRSTADIFFKTGNYRDLFNATDMFYDMKNKRVLSKIEYFRYKDKYFKKDEYFESKNGPISKREYIPIEDNPNSKFIPIAGLGKLECFPSIMDCREGYIFLGAPEEINNRFFWSCFKIRDTRIDRIEFCLRLRLDDFKSLEFAPTALQKEALQKFRGYEVIVDFCSRKNRAIYLLLKECFGSRKIKICKIGKYLDLAKRMLILGEKK